VALVQLSIDDYAERSEQTVTAWTGMNGRLGLSKSWRPSGPRELAMTIS
jgi:hypothetical protein